MLFVKQSSQNPCSYPKICDTRRELLIFLLTNLEYRLNEHTKLEQDFERHSYCEIQMFLKEFHKAFSFTCFSHTLRLLIYIIFLFIFNSLQKHMQGKDNRDKSLAL